MNEFKFEYGETVYHCIDYSVPMMIIGRVNAIKSTDTTAPPSNRYRCRYFMRDRFYAKWFYEFELEEQK